MFFEQVSEFKFDEVYDFGFLDEIHFVEEDEDVVDSDLSAKEYVFLGLGHGSVHCGYDEYACVHFGCSCDHVFDVVDVSRAVDVCVVSALSFVLKGSSVDGDTSSFFLWGFVDFAVFDVFGFLASG